MSKDKNSRSNSAARESAMALVANAPGVMLLMDYDGLLLSVSAIFPASVGLPLEKIIGANVSDLFPEGRLTTKDMQARATVGPVNFGRMTTTLPSGEVNSFELWAWPWFEAPGEPGGFVALVRDVTREQIVLAELERTQSMLHAVIESIPAMVTVVDLNTGLTRIANGAFAAYIGHSQDDLVGFGPAASLDPEEVRAFKERFALLEHEGGVLVQEREATDSAGRRRVFVQHRQVITDQLGGRYALSVSNDVTDYRLAQKALQAALVEAETANRAKSAFLANMSHEIRTPLNGVLGMAQVMANEPLDPPQRTRLQVIQESGQALMAILNDLLDLSKVEAGKLELESIPFYPGAALEGAVANFRAIAAEKGVGLELDAEGLRDACLGDPARLRQIVSNLVSNALKFTDTGEVRVVARRSESGIGVEVLDTGPGIPEEVAERLFQRFSQADTSTTRRFGGTGLGLAICRELVELMGGTISVRNRAGGGAAFAFTLPVEPTDQAPAVSDHPSALVAPTPDLRILAAEDNPVNQKVLATILGQAGLPVTMVADGAQALEAFAVARFDLVLMDVQMPVMDGEEATRRIRELEHRLGASRTPIIGLTANAMAHQKAEYKACGMDAIVAKPLDVGELFATIEEVFASQPSEPAASRRDRRDIA